MNLIDGPNGLSRDEQIVQQSKIRDASELSTEGPLAESDLSSTPGTFWDHDPSKLDAETRAINVRGLAAARRMIDQARGPEGK